MKLMLRSQANLLVSIRRVTQENQGKRTSGLDGQTAQTPQSRVLSVKGGRRVATVGLAS